MKYILDRLVKTAIQFLLFAGITYGEESLFPKIPGWQVNIESEVYDSNNLWDIIDGAADLYLEYSFIDLHTARYINADSIEVRVELYKHSLPINAFGMYTQERDPSYNFIKVGVQGYLQEGVLNFVDGVYYVKLSTYEKGKDGHNALIYIARKLDEALNQDNSFPKILDCFPSELKIPNTEKYIAHNFLGYSFLNSVMTVIYKDSINYSAFIITATNAEEADAVEKQFINSQKKDNVSKYDNTGYELQNQDNEPMTLNVRGQYIYGLINCSNKAECKKLMEELGKKLSEI